jgi:hypothetical protein
VFSDLWSNNTLLTRRGVLMVAGILLTVKGRDCQLNYTFYSAFDSYGKPPLLYPDLSVTNCAIWTQNEEVITVCISDTTEIMRVTCSIGRSKYTRSCECRKICSSEEQSPFWEATSRLVRLGICNMLCNRTVGCHVEKSSYRTICWALSVQHTPPHPDLISFLILSF